MNFQPQSILIDTKEGDMVIEAMAAIDAGLAYHRHCMGKGKFGKTYGVTILSSGLSVSSSLQLPTAKHAQHFIELLTKITDWSRPKEEMNTLDREKLKPQVVKAYNQALQEQENEVME